MVLFNFRKKSDYVLMHRSVPVLKGDYDFQKHGFSEIHEIMHPEHLPIGTSDNGKLSVKRLNHWFRWRGIPGYRVGLPQLMTRLSVREPLDLLEREYALSVSDTYWMKKEDDPGTWKQLNFFDRSFDQSQFGRAMFSQLNFHADSSARHTPNNTTAGYHRKAWFRRNGELYLLKGGSPLIQEEPVNEWLASQIAERLGIPHVAYTLENYENQLVCACRNLCDSHTDLVPASDILAIGAPTDVFQLDYYQQLLINHGIKDAVQRLDDMMVLDYLMMNTDRHDQNMAVLVDARTMEWKSVAPVFDTGTGLGALLTDDELDHIEENDQSCRLLNARNFSHEELLGLICDIHRYNFSSLNEIWTGYGKMLQKYQMITGISNRRINALYQLIYRRIVRIMQYQASH